MDLSEVFKALGDPTRLKIVCMLAEAGELCVCKIVEELDMGQSAISHHLAKLRYAGILRTRRQGQWIHYSLNIDVLDKDAFAFIKQLIKTAKVPKTEAESYPIDCCKESK